MKLTWLGHNCWLLETGNHRVLIDPFLDDSPVAPMKAAEVEADFVLVSHGHFDHISDAVPIVNRAGAKLLTNFEISQWVAQQGVPAENVVGMNHGGGVDLPFGRVEYTIAHHSSSLPDGSYGGNPGGFLLTIDRKRLYFACDTCLFLEMQLIAAKGLALAVVPIGDLFTMGPEASIEALKLLAPQRALPCHYNTWPPIAQDADRWAEQVREQTSTEPVVLQPGASIDV